jgi:hypothetical protein
VLEQIVRGKLAVRDTFLSFLLYDVRTLHTKLSGANPSDVVLLAHVVSSTCRLQARYRS